MRNNNRATSHRPVPFLPTSLNNSFNTCNESAFVDGIDITVNFDMLSCDNISMMSQANKLNKNDIGKRFFGKKTKDLDSKQIKEASIYSQIRNIKFVDGEDMDQVIFISTEGTEFRKKDVYWVRRFQNAWRLRQFKNLTMKIVKERIRFRKEQEAADLRRKKRNNPDKKAKDGASLPPRSKKKAEKPTTSGFKNIMQKIGVMKDNSDYNVSRNNSPNKSNRKRSRSKNNNDVTYEKNLMNFVEDDRKKSKKFTDILFSRGNSRDKSDKASPNKRSESSEKPVLAFGNLFNRNS